MVASLLAGRSGGQCQVETDYYLKVTSAMPVRSGGMVQVADYPPGADFGPRELHDFEFVWVLRGSAVWTVRQRPAAAPVDCLLRPGTLALARAGTVDSYHWDDDMGTTHAYVHFAMDPAGLVSTAGWPATRSMTASPVL